MVVRTVVQLLPGLIASHEGNKTFSSAIWPMIMEKHRRSRCTYANACLQPWQAGEGCLLGQEGGPTWVTR